MWRALLKILRLDDGDNEYLNNEIEIEYHEDEIVEATPTSVIEEIKSSGSREMLVASRDLDKQDDVLTSRKLD